MPTDILAKLPYGVWVLTEAGELGLHDAQQGLHLHETLNHALGGHLRDFLHAYRAAPPAADRRVAILYESSRPRPWGALTLSFEDAALRSLYPVGGRNNDSSLTAFQQKNRAVSFYRGMELMLEFQRRSPSPGRHFCPVLYAASASLADRASARGAQNDEPDATPVLDVLNLAVGQGAGPESGEALAAVTTWLREQLIRRDLRHERQFSLLNQDLAGAATGAVDNPFGYVERDKRLLREVTVPMVDARRLHDTERVESIERWLRIPYQAVEPGRLREFVQFRDLDDASLAELVPRSLVYSAPAGTRLLDRDLGDAWNFYLLEGSVMLTPADGLTLRVDAGSAQASYPIAFLKPRIYSVDAMTPVSFLWVHDLLLQALRRRQPEATAPGTSARRRG